METRNFFFHVDFFEIVVFVSSGRLVEIFPKNRFVIGVVFFEGGSEASDFFSVKSQHEAVGADERKPVGDTRTHVIALGALLPELLLGFDRRVWVAVEIHFVKNRRSVNSVVKLGTKSNPDMLWVPFEFALLQRSIGMRET